MSKRLRFYFNGLKVAPGGAVVCTMSHPQPPKAQPPPHI
jgi:hypothetical protein